MTKHYSLRKRLFTYISLPLLLASAFTLMVAFYSAWHEIEEVYDAQLVNSSKVLLQLMEHEIIEEGDNQDFTILAGKKGPEHTYEKNIALRIWHKNKLITQSTNAKGFAELQAPPGFSDQIINQEKWRFFVYIDTDSYIRVETSERYYIRYELIFEIILSLMIPALIFIPLVFFIVWVAIKRNLESVISISSNVDKRNSDDLSAITYSHLPEEVTPLIQAINRLFNRLQYSFKREKEFTDHAAHELRTPLAAMKTQAQVIQKYIEKGVDIKEDLVCLLESINRSTDLVDQLLTLSRLQSATFPKSPVNLSNCLLETLQSLNGLVDSKQINLSLAISENVMTVGHKDSLGIMFSNLLTNAIKYTPVQGFISLHLSEEGMFTLVDSGPGISEVNQAKVFERFFRADNTGEIGTGLGLSIVKWIAGVHKLDIKLATNQPSGLIVEIPFSD